MPQSQIETLNQTGTDPQPQSGQPRGAATDALSQRLQSALLLLFDQLRIDQFRGWLDDRLARPPALACAGELLNLMIDSDERWQVAAEAIAEETGHATNNRRRQLKQVQGALAGTWANIGGQQQTEFRCKTDPHPLPSISALLRALTVFSRRLSVLAQDEGPQLIQLHTRDLDFTQQVLVDHGGLLCRAPQPFEDRLFGDAEGAAHTAQLDFAQQQLEHEDDFLFTRAQVKKDCRARLGELFAAEFAVKDAPSAALGRVSRNRADIATVQQSIMRASRVGARLAPVLGFSQGSVLRLVRSRNHNFSGKTGPFLFQSISG